MNEQIENEQIDYSFIGRLELEKQAIFNILEETINEEEVNEQKFKNELFDILEKYVEECEMKEREMMAFQKSLMRNIRKHIDTENYTLKSANTNKSIL